jgi:flagellar hook-length control protein FliK
LAGHLQQLSLFDAARAEHATATRAPALSQQSVQVRVDASTPNGGLASVELSHPELGQVGLAIELADGAVRITATATSARSADVIQQGQALLAQRLLHQGVVLEALDVVIVRKRKPAKRASRAQQRARKEDS